MLISSLEKWCFISFFTCTDVVINIQCMNNINVTISQSLLWQYGLQGIWAVCTLFTGLLNSYSLLCSIKATKTWASVVLASRNEKRTFTIDTTTLSKDITSSISNKRETWRRNVFWDNSSNLSESCNYLNTFSLVFRQKNWFIRLLWKLAWIKNASERVCDCRCARESVERGEWVWRKWNRGTAVVV